MKDPAGTLIMELHLRPDAPGSPMTMICRAQLEYLQRMEAEALTLREILGAVRAALELPGCQNLPHTMKKATD
jgi:hypothetical protein